MASSVPEWQAPQTWAFAKITVFLSYVYFFSVADDDTSEGASSAEESLPIECREDRKLVVYVLCATTGIGWRALGSWAV